MTGKQLRRGLPAAVVLSGNLGPTGNLRTMNQIALAITRSLGRRGVPVYRFHPDRSLYDLESRYCTHVPCPNLYDDEDGLSASLGSFAAGLDARPVLFAASDGAADFISRNSDALEPLFAVSSPPSECVGAIQDKRRLYERAQQVGVAVPKTYFPADAGELASAARSIRYPAVLKPLTSHHWKGEAVVRAIGHVKAIEVADPEALTEAYERVAPLAPSLMVQEIIPGEDARLLTFLGCLGRDGRALAGCVRKKLRQSPPGFGYCCLTETVPDREVLDASLRLLSALGYRGIGCVEFKRDPRDGILKLIEINARAVRTTGAAVGAGVDLPYIAYQDAVGRPAPPCFKYKKGMRWIHLKDEMLAARELIHKGELTLWQWSGIFRGHLVFAEWARDDPRPFFLAWRPFVSRVLRRICRRPVEYLRAPRSRGRQARPGGSP